MSKRKGEISRETSETKVDLLLDLDEPSESGKIDTGSGFMDHMLTLMSAHGRFKLEVKCKGDTYVDFHHSIEDIGIAMGLALKEAMGDLKGIKRYSHIILPMDETLILEAIDISGRAYLNFDVEFTAEKVGEIDTELFKEFFIALTRKAEITLHIIGLEGENNHHIAEGCFKAFGRILGDALSINEIDKDRIPSTKGVLV